MLYKASNGKEYQACQTQYEGLYDICEVDDFGGLIDLGMQYHTFLDCEEDLAEFVEYQISLESYE